MVNEDKDEVKLTYNEFLDVMKKHSCGSCIHQENKGCSDECIDCYLNFQKDYNKRWGLK